MPDNQPQQFNADALQAQISETVKATINGMAQEAQAREAEARRVAAQNRQTGELMQDPVAQTVLSNPAVQKVLGDVAFTAQNAQDESRFYRNNPEAAARANEIEQIAAASRINRDSAYSFLIGQDARRAQAAARAAAGEMNVGPGGIGRPDPTTRLEITPNMSLDEMRKVMATPGVTF